MTTVTTTQPPSWVNYLDSSGNGVGPTILVPSTLDTSLQVEWTPEDGALIWIGQSQYTVAEARRLNTRRLRLLLALAHAGNEESETIVLPEWAGTLTFSQALDVVAATARALEVTGYGRGVGMTAGLRETAVPTVTELVALRKACFAVMDVLGQAARAGAPNLGQQAGEFLAAGAAYDAACEAFRLWRFPDADRVSALGDVVWVQWSTSPQRSEWVAA